MVLVVDEPGAVIGGDVVSQVSRLDRAVGAVLGSAVGDALGAPFEFGPPLAFSRHFPQPGAGGEMCGGGGWDPGEFTDDTQMALLVAESLLDRDGFDGADMFGRFQRWAASRPKDIGVQTSAVLSSGRAWDTAAAHHFAQTHRAAGNGSLMRAAPAAVFFAAQGRAATMEAARRISALTHGDPATGEGCAVYHELVRIALDGGDPLIAMDDVVSLVADEHRPRWAVVLAPDWEPGRATESNGAVWPTLGSAVWALRTTSGFEEALRQVIDLGGDTDTVAAVTAGLAGAVHGAAAIPDRWVTVLHGPVPGFGDHVWTAPEIARLAARLDRPPR